MRIFKEFLILGLTSFGGPTAHIGFFRDRFVEKLRWLKDEEFADLLALCQFLPGPASSQLGFAIGWKKGGVPGAFAAWLGFTLPSALLMTCIGIGMVSWGTFYAKSGLLQGLQITVVAVVFKAVWQMAASLCPDRSRALVAVAAAAFVLWDGLPFSHLIVISAGAFAGYLLLKGRPKNNRPNPVESETKQGWVSGFACLVAFVIGLIMLPWLGLRFDLVALFADFYLAGSLVFGGGHVVLPLLSDLLVAKREWIDQATFLSGYGAAQAMPGPLFTFSSFVGAAIDSSHFAESPWLLSFVALLGVFLPSWLLVWGVMPFWERLRQLAAVQGALAGANASVVGLLGAILYDPVWTGTIEGTTDAIFLLFVSALLLVLKWPPWLVVILASAAGALYF